MRLMTCARIPQAARTEALEVLWPKGSICQPTFTLTLSVLRNHSCPSVIYLAIAWGVLSASSCITQPPPTKESWPKSTSLRTRAWSEEEQLSNQRAKKQVSDQMKVRAGDASSP